MRLLAALLTVLVVAFAGAGAYLVESRSQRELHALRELAGRVDSQTRSTERLLAGLASLRAACSEREISLPAAGRALGADPAQGSQEVEATSSAKSDPRPDDAALEAAVRAGDLLEEAITRGQWTSTDERALLDTMRNLTPEDRADVLERRALAVNQRKLRVDPTALLR